MQLDNRLDHLFRHEYSRIVAYLVSQFGAAAIDSIEDAVQDALLRAVHVWGYQQVPQNPSAWLYRVARNRLIDILRRDNRLVEFDVKENDSQALPEPEMGEGEIADELLRMIFACCHPSLTAHEQVMLSLKLLCGLSVREIAKSLMRKEEAVKKAITRGKKKFKQNVMFLNVPEGSVLRERMDVVLKVIYLLFTEGYKATAGDKLIKKDICEEAIRLASLLYMNRFCRTPDLCALLALMCFNAARLDARLSGANELLTLEEQDRRLWERSYIEAGDRFLNEASTAGAVGTYQIEAGIAGYYVMAPSFKETNWPVILGLFDLLQEVNASPAVALNRVVVIEQVDGATAALEALNDLPSKTYQDNHLFFAIKARLQVALGDTAAARKNLQHAITLTANDIERHHLQKRLDGITA